MERIYAMAKRGNRDRRYNDTLMAFLQFIPLDGENTIEKEGKSFG